MACPLPISSDVRRRIDDFLPRARAYVGVVLRRRPWLRHHEGDLHAEAALGVVVGASRWEPSRGPFEAAAFWWMKAAVVRYLCRHTRVVASRWNDTRWADDTSLNARVHAASTGGPDEDVAAIQDVLTAPECTSPVDVMDTAQAVRAVAAELSGTRFRLGAEWLALAWARHTFGGEEQKQLAREAGISPEGMRKALLTAGAAAEAVAACLRAEAS